MTIQCVTLKFLEWFCCKHTCVCTVYWEDSSSKYSLWAAMHLAQWCCHCWKHFWNSCCGIAFSAIVTFFWMSSIPWNLCSFKQTLFLERARSHSEPNQGIGWMFHFSKLFLDQKLLGRSPCELEYCHGGESNHWAKVPLFFCVHIHIITSPFPHDKLGWLFSCVEWIKMSSTLDIKESYEHYLHLWFQHVNRVFHSKTLDFFKPSPL